MIPIPDASGLQFRAAAPGDAHAIAGLHADSWQRHYRGAYSGTFLDDGVTGYLLPLWTGRLAIPNPRARTIIAERDSAVIGLAHTILGEDTTWGAFLDNLHVAHGLKRRGIGTQLLALTAQAVLDASPGSGLYLWVLEQNSDARAFYTAQGGACLERDEVPPPGGGRYSAQRQADGSEIRVAGTIGTNRRPPIAATRISQVWLADLGLVTRSHGSVMAPNC